MREQDLYKPVKDWLLSQGCIKVYPEVRLLGRIADVIGIGPDLIIGVELKLSMTENVISQASTLQRVCDRTYVAVLTVPRDPSRACRQGLGILTIIGDGIYVIAESRAAYLRPHERARLLQTCSRMSTDGVGGVPSGGGV